MKALSDHARAVIDRLYKPPSWSQRLLGRSRSIADIAAIAELVDAGESAAIPYIIPILAYGTLEEVLAAARALAALRSQMAVADLPWLDEYLREFRILNSGYGDEWRHLQPEELAKWVGPGEPGILLLQLSSFHRNGFVREAAVRRLSQIHDGSELPYLLLRLNDWVPQVRQAAHDAVAARVSPNYTPHFIDNLVLIGRLQNMARTDHNALVDSILQLLMERSARPAMLRAMHDRSTEVRRTSLRFLIAGAPDDTEQVLLTAIQVADPVIRLWGVRKAATTLGRSQLLTMLNAMSANPFASVRRAVLEIWPAALPELAPDKLTAALMDASAAIRADARYYLRGHGGIDFAQHYRDALATTDAKRLATAISGLGETGDQADAEQLAAYLTHPSARVRRAVVRGLMQLAADQYIDVVMDRVPDTAPGVSAQAAKLLMPHAALIGTTRLWDRFQEPGPRHVRKNLLRLLTALPKWGSISCLLQAAADQDQAIAAQALGYVRLWNAHYNQRQITPSREQLARLRAVLASAESRLDAVDLAEIKFAVHTFSTH